MPTIGNESWALNILTAAPYCIGGRRTHICICICICICNIYLGTSRSPAALHDLTIWHMKLRLAGV
jgi:hypothetical protein